MKNTSVKCMIRRTPKITLNLYKEAEKWYQEWVSKVKAQQMMHDKQSLKGWRHDTLKTIWRVTICS